jgi:hypothetical protein
MSTATRLFPGISSRATSSRFVSSVALNSVTPVALPPGRLRLATRPDLTGSPATLNRIGIVAVAALAARATARLPTATITATRLPTRSAASAGTRLDCPPSDTRPRRSCPRRNRSRRGRGGTRRPKNQTYRAMAKRENRSPASLSAARALRAAPPCHRAAEKRDELAPSHSASPK